MAVRVEVAFGLVGKLDTRVVRMELDRLEVGDTLFSPTESDIAVKSALNEISVDSNTLEVEIKA